MKQGIYLIAGMAIGALLATSGFAISSWATTAQDPVKQSPQYYKVLLENDQVRVLDYRLKPGEKEPMHTHTAGVIYIFGDAKMRTTYPDGRTEETGGGGGEAHWRNPVTHALQNIGSTEAHVKAEEMISKFREIAATQYVPTCRIAGIYVALDEKDKAFEELNKAFEVRDWELYRLNADPYWNPLHDDSRFKDLIERLNLPK